MATTRVVFTAFVVGALCAGCSSSSTGGDNGRQSLPDPANPYYSSLTAIWAFSDRDVWAAGDRVLHYDGAQWSEIPGPTTPTPGVGLHIQALWGLAPDDLWATSGPKIYRYHGAATGWVELVHGIPNPPDFNAIWVSAEDDYVVGGGDVNSEVVRVKGTTLTRAFTYGPASAIWGAGDDDIWTVSEQGGFWHWDGTKWSNVSPTGTGGTRPRGVWGFSANDVWAVGSEQTLRHWDGTTWTATTTSESWGAVWGASTHDVWSTGDEGAVSHFDGSDWNDKNVGQGVFFTAMSGSATNSVWAVGYELSTAGNHGVVFRIR
jgi:hypothetical protein